MQLLLPLLLFACIASVTECKTDIYVLGLIPPGYRLSAYELTDQAIREINAREDILPDFELHVHWYDPYCRANFSLDEFFSIPGAVVSVFGLPCLGSTIALAEAMSFFFRTILFTHSFYVPDIRDPNSFILNGFPTGINTVTAQLKFISDHNWTRVASINYESIYFIDLGYELQRGFYRLNITSSVHSVSSALPIQKYKPEVDELIRVIDSAGFRVVVFNMFLEEAEYILCRMRNMSIDFDKYTIILPGFIHRTNSSGNTTECDVQEILKGAIGFIERPRVEDIR